MEVFGETPFAPLTKEEAINLDEKQQQLSVLYDNKIVSTINVSSEALKIARAF